MSYKTKKLFTSSTLDAIANVMREVDRGTEDKELITLREKWKPPHRPSQQRAFESQARFPLIYGGRYSGKGYCAANMAIEDAYEEHDACVVIFVRTIGNAKPGGIWDKMQKENLPLWAKHKGLEYFPEQFRDGHYSFAIKNKFGTYSWFHLRSCQHSTQVEGKFRGIEPTSIVWDEVTTFDSPDFFLYISQSLGRRKTKRQQRLICVTNPDSPDHWAYKKWFVPDNDGKFDENYPTFLCPIEEVEDLLPNPDYPNQLKASFRDNPIMLDRMLHSKWVALPRGDSIFGKFFFPNIHLWPKSHAAFSSGGIIPSPKFPVLVGYDLGPANPAITLSQWIPASSDDMFSVFDEAVYVDKRYPYMRVVYSLLTRMAYWQEVVGEPLRFVHISDKNAFDRTNQSGSTEASIVEMESAKLIQAHKDRFAGLSPIFLQEAPKPSVASRSRMLIERLVNNTIAIDKRCNSQYGVINMISNLVNEKTGKNDVYTMEDQLTPANHCKNWKHVFDALTYTLAAIQHGTVNLSARNINNEDRCKIFSAG